MACICVSKVSFRKLARCKIRANNTFIYNAPASVKSSSNVRKTVNHLVDVKSKLQTISNLRSKNLHNINLLVSKHSKNSKINAKLQMSGVLHARLSSNSTLETNYTEKLGGSLNNFDFYKQKTCLQKLYPSDDVSNDGFIDKNFNTTNLFESINEGIFSKDTDELDSYIQPSSINTAGFFSYKLRLDDPYIRPQKSLLLIRASAPLKNYASNTAPIYKISNIKFEDPSGNLIIKYRDFNVRGDADYSTVYTNFSTYVSEPEINRAALNYWQDGYPLLSSGLQSSENLLTELFIPILTENNEFINTDGMASGYTLSFDVLSECLDDPFNEGYDSGYEENLCNLPTGDFSFFHTILQ